MQKLKDFIGKYIELTDEDLKQLSQHIKIKRFKKNETIHRIGDIFKNIYTSSTLSYSFFFRYCSTIFKQIKQIMNKCE